MSAQRVLVTRIGVGLAVAAALLTSACAAGQHAQTANEKPTINGTNASVGSIDLRAIVIEPPSGTTPYYPSGSDMALKIVIVNNATQPDELTSITSTAVSDWGAFTTTADADAVVAANAAAQAPTSAPPSAASTAPQSTSAPSPSAGTSSTPVAQLPTPQRTVPIAANGRVGYGTPEATGALLLIGANRDIYPATSISLTFRFANAGSVTVLVPVGASLVMPASVIPAPPSSSLEG